MKLKLIAAVLLAGSSLCAFGQGYKDGIEYYKAERYTNAKELLERNLNNAGTDKSASYYYLGQIAIHNNNLTEAKADFQKGIEANPENPYNYVGMGHLALITGDTKAAQEQFKIAEKHAKKDTSVEVDIARAYYATNPALYAKEVEKRMQKAYKKDAKNPSYYIFLADQAFDNKDWGTAAGMFEMAYTFAPKAAEAYVKNADIHLDVNPNYSIQQLKTLLANNPESALGQRELANTYYTLNRYKEAAEQYGKYVNNPNHFTRDEDRYSFLLFYGGDFQKGYDYATQLLAKNPDNFTAMRYQFMNAAQLDGLKGKRLPMAEKLLATHRANPTENELAQIDYTLIAEELKSDNRPDQAIDVYEEAIKTYPKAAQFDKGLAFIYIDKEDYAKAAQTYQQYIKKLDKPTYNDLIQEAKLAYFGGLTTSDTDASLSKSMYAAADDYAKQAAKADDTQYSPYKVLGDVKVAQADKANLPKVAVADYQNALDKLAKVADPTKYATDGRAMCVYLGNYYLTNKDIAKAKEYFNQALVFEPNNTEIQDWLKKL